MDQDESTSTDETDEAVDDRRSQTTQQVTWNVEVGTDPAGGFGWWVWTDDSLWLPTPVAGRAASEEDAYAVARDLAVKCTDASALQQRDLHHRILSVSTSGST